MIQLFKETSHMYQNMKLFDEEVSRITEIRTRRSILLKKQNA
jgi:hypothetical protein